MQQEKPVILSLSRDTVLGAEIDNIVGFFLVSHNRCLTVTYAQEDQSICIKDESLLKQYPLN